VKHAHRPERLVRAAIRAVAVGEGPARPFKLSRAALRAVLACGAANDSGVVDPLAAMLAAELPAPAPPFRPAALLKTARRARAIDEMVMRFVETSEEPSVVCFGSCLATRGHRLGPPCPWVDVDEPRVAMARSQWLPARGLHVQASASPADAGFFTQLFRWRERPVFIVIEDAWAERRESDLAALVVGIGAVVPAGTDLVLSIGGRTGSLEDLVRRLAGPLSHWEASLVDAREGYALLKSRART
jgi:hypothetical protein